MTGLLLKDFLYFKNQGKSLLIMIVFFSVFFSIFLKNGLSYLTAMIVVMSMSLVINTFAYDELAKWDCFAFSLPVTRNQAVLSRYLFALILSLGTTAFALLMTAVAGRGSVTLEEWGSVYAAFGVSVALSSVLIPLIYRFGVQKARIAMLVLVLAPFFLVLLIQKLNPGLFSGGMPSDAQILFWLKLSPVLLVAVFGGSFLISCGIMEKKEV
jgi:ABC-type transport system involved in multi-copper enzyme maturation permease subunit